MNHQPPHEQPPHEASRDHNFPYPGPPDPPTTLLEGVNALAERVQTLTEKVDVSARLARQTRWLALGLGAVMLAGLVFGYIYWDRTSQAVDGNSENAVQSCENANETRAANLTLWTTLLNYTKASADPETVEQMGKLQGWVAVLYQPHDCDDLGRVYEIPSPPVLMAE